MEWSGLNGQNMTKWEWGGPNRTKKEQMDRLGSKWTYGPNRIMLDWIGPMSTKVDRMNGIGPIWTE